MKKLLLILVLAVMCSSVTRADDLDDGYAAYNKGNYTQAIELFRPLATQGYADAQYKLGVMYAYGKGVIQDYKEARKWNLKAAEQGHAGAQFKLGVIYAWGKDVLQDYVRAHMWLNLAASKGSKEAIEHREIVAKKMTPSKVSEAQDMAKDCKKKNYKNCE